MFRWLLLALVASQGASLRRARDGGQHMSDRKTNARLYHKLWWQLLPQRGRHTTGSLVEETSDRRVGYSALATRMADSTRAGGTGPFRRRHRAYNCKSRVAAARNARRSVRDSQNVSCRLVYDFVKKRLTVESLASYSNVQVLYIALKTCTFANVFLCDTHLIVHGTSLQRHWA